MTQPFEVTQATYDPEFLLVDNEEVTKEQLIAEAQRQAEENQAQ